MKKHFLFSALVAAFSLCAATAFSGEKSDSPKKTKNPESVFFRHPQQTLDKLTKLIDEWHAAVLASERGRSERIENKILSVISEDITSQQMRVRELAHEVTSEPPVKSSADQGVDGKEYRENPVPNDAAENEFREHHTLLKAKQIIARSVRNSKAFSNKYRLLGDYVDLLRRELGMARVKWANNASNK